MNKEKIKDKYYIVFPIISLLFWSIYALIVRDFYQVFIFDFNCLSSFVKTIQKDPRNLYYTNGYYYSPFYAILFSLTLSNFDIRTALILGFIINIVLSIILIFEFDKLLRLLNIDRIYRLIFLLILMNGWKLYSQFYMVQSKILSCLCLVLIIKRERG